MTFRIRSRKAHSLVEILIIAVPTILILGVCLYMLSRMSYQDSWNDTRLRSTEAVLMSWENLRTDMANQAGGAVETTENGLIIQRQLTGVAAEPEVIRYTHDAGARKLERNGRGVGNAPIDQADFSWVQEYQGARYNSLLRARITSRSGTESGPVKSHEHALEGLIHVPAKANAQRYSGWVTDVTP